MFFLRYAIQFIEKVIDGAALAYILILVSQHADAVSASRLAMAAVIISAAFGFAVARVSDSLNKTTVLTLCEAIRGMLLVSVWMWPEAVVALAATYVGLMIFQAVVTPVADALALDHLEPVAHRKLFAKLYWVTNLARLFGLTFGLFSIQHDGFPTLCGVLGVVCLGLALRLRRIRLGETASVATSSRSDLKLVKRDWKLPFIVLCAGYTGAWGLSLHLTNYIGVDYAARFADPQVIAVNHIASFALDGVQLFFIARFGSCLIAVITQHWVERAFPAASEAAFRARLLSGSLIFGAGMLALTLSTSWFHVALGVVLYTFGELLYAPLIRVFAARVIPAAQRTQGLFLFGILPHRSGQLMAAALVSLAGTNDARITVAFVIVLFTAAFCAGLALAMHLAPPLPTASATS